MTLYKTSPQTFEEVIAPLPEAVQKNAAELRKMIQKELPEADESIYGGTKMGMALYSIGDANNVLCGVQPTTKTCKFFFHEWKELKRQGYKLEGSGKNARHVKVNTLTDELSQTIREMLNIVKRKKTDL